MVFIYKTIYKYFYLIAGVHYVLRQTGGDPVESGYRLQWTLFFTLNKQSSIKIKNFFREINFNIFNNESSRNRCAGL